MKAATGKGNVLIAVVLLHSLAKPHFVRLGFWRSRLLQSPAFPTSIFVWIVQKEMAMTIRTAGQKQYNSN
jgi:hypothetical protein